MNRGPTLDPDRRRSHPTERAGRHTGAREPKVPTWVTVFRSAISVLIVR
jgi:hypothetical protein